MRLVVLIALSHDRRAGVVVEGPAPYDQLVTSFKKAVASEVSPAEFPILEIWANSGVHKSHKFRKVAFPKISDAQVHVLLESQNLDLSAQCEALRSQVDDLTAKLKGAQEGIKRLSEAAKKAAQTAKAPAPAAEPSAAPPPSATPPGEVAPAPVAPPDTPGA